MTKLSEDDYWDRLYMSGQGRWGATGTGDYADYLLWEGLFRKYLSGNEGAKILEIGSAPGDFLVKVSKKFNLIPWGVELTPHGVELNRNIFKYYHIDPNQITQADFLSADFQRKNSCAFNIVMSRGVIEHFTNVGEAIDKHISLLSSGGLLLVSIPNLRGFNGFLARMFDRETLAMHNLDIMDQKVFSRLFVRKDLHPLFCDYYGTFSFNLFNARRYSLSWIFLAFCRCLQLILNVVLRFLFRVKGKENHCFSPYLMFIGRKL